MKKLIASALCLAFLTSCGSDSKPGASSGGGGSGSVTGGKCPVWNGTYSRKETSNDADGKPVEITRQIRIATKVEGGTYSYDFTGENRFVTADGQMKRIQSEGQEGDLQVTCDASSVSVMTRQEEQEATTIKYVAVSDKLLRVDSDNPDVAEARGTYTKE